jgi:diacylglycerol kinase family enzyme
VLHLGLIKTGLAQASPLGQGHAIKITTTAPLHMQIDGEPSYIEPATVQIDFAGRYDSAVFNFTV